MFVKAMEYGPSGEQVVMENPSWIAVENTIRLLDGEHTDGVTIDCMDNSYLAVSGGNDNQYIVAGYLEGFGSFICAGGHKDGPCASVAVAGDTNTYPSKNVVDIETAISAAKAFCERGVLLEQLAWEKQDLR